MLLSGVELSSFSERSSWSDLPAPPDAGVVTLSELDTVMKHASEMAGAGWSRLRADLFLNLVRRLTAEERMLVLGLLRGGLHQGVESVVMAAVAQAGGVACVARALLVDGPAGVE
ncbi:MAG: hypothetical protein HHJ13_11850 [Phycicoccus sp.]|nr:hypothetical protein [Phycicoccus sp.]